MESVKRNIIPFMLGFILTIALSAAGAALGATILPIKNMIPAIVCLVLVILLALWSYRKLENFLQPDFASFRQHMVDERERAEADYDMYQRECAGVYRRFWLQMGGSYLLLALMIVLSAACAAETGSSFGTLFYLIGFYAFWGLFAWMKKTGTEEDFDPEDVLDPEEYPAFTELLRSVFHEDKKDPIMVSYGPAFNNIGVSKSNDRTYIALGSFPVALLNREELCQVLLHEKGHKQDQPGDVQIKAWKLINEHDLPSDYSSILTPVDKLFIHLVSLGLLMEQASIIINRQKERRADEYAREHGDPQAYMSALAKMDMLNMFQKDSDDYRYDPYEDEEYYPCCIEADINAFARALADKKGFWKDILENQLPPLMDSHPSFPERREAMGYPAYDVILPPMWTGTDCTTPEGKAQLREAAESGIVDPSLTEFQKEQLKLVRWLDKTLTEAVRPTYAEQRKENWETPSNVICTYENDVRDGIEYSVLEMRPVLDAYLLMGRNEKLETLCRDCISRAANDSEAAHASWLLGTVLLKRYDKECIEHLYRAAGNHNYMEDAYELIGDFCLQMHLQEELEEFRVRYGERVQTYIDNDEDEYGVLKKKDRLSEETELPEELQKANIEFISNAFGPMLKELYQVHKQITDSFSCTAYVVVTSDGYDEEAVWTGFNKVFEYLDNQEHQYSLFDIEDLPDLRAEDLPGRVR